MNDYTVNHLQNTGSAETVDTFQRERQTDLLGEKIINFGFHTHSLRTEKSKCMSKNDPCDTDDSNSIDGFNGNWRYVCVEDFGSVLKNGKTLKEFTKKTL